MDDIASWLDSHREKAATVEGWVERGAYDLIVLMHHALSMGSQPVPGGVLEIGVHHGKFFIPLNALVNPGFKSVALDLYEEQQYLNIDYSGRGSRAAFETNLVALDRHGGRNVIVEVADSVTISPDTILEKAGHKFKIVSVDGGHTAEHTVSDIFLAQACVHPLGFVIVDDILNSHWLGVIDGVTTFLRMRPTLWPLALGHNKLIMCPMSIYPTFAKFFKESGKFSVTTRLCNYEVLAV